MKNSLRSWSWVSVLSLFAFALAVRGEGTAGYGTAAGSIVVPEGVSSADVSKAIQTAAIGRGWNIISRDSEKIVVALTQDTWSSKLTLVYSARDVQFYSISTRKGKPKLPENWIKFLKQDTLAKLNLLLVERAEVPRAETAK